MIGWLISQILLISKGNHSEARNLLFLKKTNQVYNQKSTTDDAYKLETSPKKHSFLPVGKETLSAVSLSAFIKNTPLRNFSPFNWGLSWPIQLKDEKLPLVSVVGIKNYSFNTPKQQRSYTCMDAKHFAPQQRGKGRILLGHLPLEEPSPSCFAFGYTVWSSTCISPILNIL